MAVRVFLILTETQTVPADEQYHIVRFRFGDGESYDEHRMHEARQPDGVSTTFRMIAQG